MRWWCGWVGVAGLSAYAAPRAFATAWQWQAARRGARTHTHTHSDLCRLDPPTCHLGWHLEQPQLVQQHAQRVLGVTRPPHNVCRRGSGHAAMSMRDGRAGCEPSTTNYPLPALTGCSHCVAAPPRAQQQVPSLLLVGPAAHARPSRGLSQAADAHAIELLLLRLPDGVPRRHVAGALSRLGVERKGSALREKEKGRKRGHRASMMWCSEEAARCAVRALPRQPEQHSQRPPAHLPLPEQLF